MSGRTVRQEFVAEFRNLPRNSRAKAGLILGAYVLQWAAAGGIGYWLLQFPLTVTSGAGLALVMFFIGTRLRGLNNIIHECSHFTFSSHRVDNAVIGSIAAALVLTSFRDYRDEHMTHHAHLGDYEKDMDLQGIQDLRLEEPLTPRTVLRHVFTALSGLHLPYYLNVNLSGRDGEGYRLLKVALIASATVFLVLDPLAALLLMWLPYVWIYTTINYWTDCIDHGGLVESGDELEASRNFLVPKQLRALLFPRNDCYHLIHHLFPQIPAHHFDECHERLLANPAYRSRVGAEWDAPPSGKQQPITATPAVSHG